MPSERQPIRFGVFEVNLDTGEVRRAGVKVRLQEQPFQVLAALLEKPGEVITKEELQERIWKDDTFVDFDRSLATAINKVRQALGDSATRPHFIETVAKRGYRFIGTPTGISDTGQLPPEEVPVARSRQLSARVATAFLAIALLGALGFYLTGGEPASTDQDLSPRRFSFSVTGASGPQISPDGKSVLYVREHDAGQSLWIRSLATEVDRELSGTAGAVAGFWSPDSSEVAFATNLELKRVSVAAGNALTLCDLPGRGFYSFEGGTWSPDGGRIVFSSRLQIYVVSARGGKPALFFEHDIPGVGYVHPQFLPVEGAGALLFEAGADTRSDIYVRGLAEEANVALGSGAKPVYSPSGHVVYQTSPNEGGLWAFPFDPGSLAAGGDRFLVAEGLAFPSVAEDGTLVALDHEPESQALAAFDRTGLMVERSDASYKTIHEFDLSPDGAFAVVAAAGDVYVEDLRRGVSTQLTFTSGSERFPVWTPWGAVFGQTKSGLQHVPFDLSRPPSPLVGGGEQELIAYDVSPDGTTLLYGASVPPTEVASTNYDIWLLKRDGENAFSEPREFLIDRLETVDAQFSADGRYVAYASRGADHRWDVFVQPFEKNAARKQVTPDGGAQVRWNPAGGELFFVLDGKLYAVDVNTSGPLEVGFPQLLFGHPSLQTLIGRPQYDVLPGGERFLLRTSDPHPDDRQPAIRLLLNWLGGVQ